MDPLQVSLRSTEVLDWAAYCPLVYLLWLWNFGLQPWT